MPGLADLLGQTNRYVPSWVREFYASLWIDPGHRYIHFAFRGCDYRLPSSRATEILRILDSSTRLHEICYGQTEPPRRPQDEQVPPKDLVRACFIEPFGEGSSRTPRDLTPTACILDSVMRTLLPRGGYREGLTRLQLWLLHHLISQTIFYIWDVMLSAMEDTLAEGFKGHRQMSYAHWITFFIWKVVTQMSPETVAEWSGATTEFLKYDMT
jgi:hypothetical protein